MSTIAHKIRSRTHFVPNLAAGAGTLGKRAVRLGLNFWIVAGTVLVCLVFASWVLSGLLIERFSVRVVAAAEGSITDQKQPQLELHIANNGLVYMQGARVISISRTTLVVASEWDAGAFRWSVETDGKTRVVLADGEKGDFSDVRVGAYVNINGLLVPSTFGQAMQAESIRLVYPEAGHEPVQLKELER